MQESVAQVKRDGENKPASPSRLALNPDSACMHFHKLLDRRNPGSCPCLIPIFGFFKLCKRLKDLPGFLFDIPIPVSLTVISASMSVNLALISFRRLACQLRTSVKNSLNDSGHEKSHRIKKIIKELVDGCFTLFQKTFLR